MTGTTISGAHTTGVTLSSTSSNPVSVTGSISVTSGNALTGVGGDSWTIGNSGTILSTAGTGNGIRFGSFTTTVTNAVLTNKSGGLISASGTLGYGVFVYGPGSVTNLSGGTITAGHIAVDFNSSVGTIINYGVILASSNVAAYEREGGVITNLAGGTISGATGVWFQYAAGTFTNAGTVIGSASQDGAVLFNDQTSANLLIVDPGAVFTGAINGGLGALQLASASTTGTLSGFGATSITNFGTLQFDTGAKWTVAGNTSAAGLGTVAITGFTINDTIELTNFAAVSETFAANALVLTNAATAHATLHIQGSFTSGSFQLGGNGTTSTYITLAPPPSPLVYGQTIDVAGTVATSETVTAGTMTLFNSGSTAVGTIVVGTSLNTGDFTLKSDGSLGTDVIVNTVFGTYASGVRLVTNPATVAATAQVSNAAGSGVAVAGLTTAVTGLTNLGSIIETGTAGYGVSLGVGGVIINSTSALISAAKIGIAATSNYLTLNNSGTIRATTDEAVNFVTGTVVNSGLITGFYRGVYAAGATTVTNLAGGTITGSGTSAAVGVLLRGPTTVTNNGTVEGAIDGLELVSAAATLTNTGAVLATGAMSVGVAMLSGGTITNSTGGTIRAVTGIRFSGVSGALYNSGTVQGTSSSGVYISGGMVVNSGLILGGGASPAVFSSGTASITNLATGTISGAIGVLFNGTIAHTLINAGTITGTGGTAVSFTVSGDNVLIDDPGAVFIGTINGAAGLGPATIELASAASAGTISGFGSTVVNFDTLVFEPGALWTVAGSDSLAALGGVEIGGFSTGDTIDLTGFAATTKTFVNNVLTISAGTLHATLNMAGALNASNFSLAAVGTTATDITFVPGYLNYGETFDEAGLTVTSESVTAGVLTMFNGTTAIGTINVGTSLNTGSFNLKSDGSGGTDVIVNTMVGTYAAGVTLVTNPSTIAATARIAYATNSANAVTGPTGTAWTLTNLGSVSATGTGSAYGVFLKAGGTVTNAAVILATGNASVGVAITGGGFVTNSAGAVITGGTYGVKITGAAGTVNNRGTIQGTNGLGIGFTAGGTVVNYGLIENTGNHHALYINGAGAVTNQASATITGAFGVEFNGSSAHTLTNFGTITGNSGTAVSFSAGTNRVIDEAGAVFTGDVIGGGTSTMELAAGGAGTIAGFGTSIINFNSLVFDPGAQWTVSGNDSASGLGTLSISGFSVGDTIDLNGFVAVSRTFAGSSLVLTNTASAHETLTLPGSFSTASFAIGAVGTTATSITLVTASLDYGQTVDAAGIVATSETVTAGTMTLFNSGTTAVGSIVVGTSLSTGDFTLKSDGSGGTDVIVSTVFGTYASGVTLLTNPTTIASTALISSAALGGNAVTGPAGTTWTVTNQATITETGGNGIGVFLQAGGTVVNAGNIAISTGGADAIAITGAGSVTNQSGGTISVASATAGSGIRFGAAGNLTNNGTIEGGYSVIDGGGLLTVSNTGLILSTGTASEGVLMVMGGLLSNSSGGTISGGGYGVLIANAAGTVINSGSIQGTLHDAVYLDVGTVVNSGLIAASGTAQAVYFSGAGSVTNLATGMITAVSVGGIDMRAGGNVVNNGTIRAGFYGVTGPQSLTVANTGVILGTGSNSSGVKLGSGGYVTNSVGGIINATGGVSIAGSPGTVVNGGTIEGTAGNAVYLQVGTVVNSGVLLANGVGFSKLNRGIYIYGNGDVTNLVAGTITGNAGVFFSGGYTDTLNNSGTIIATGSLAVSFNGGGTHRLVDNPGAVFTGGIYGGTFASAVMELASGSSVGTVSGFGTTITNFNTLTFDAGARWIVAGNDSATGLGTLGISGFAGGDTIDLTGFVAVSDTFGSNLVTFTNAATQHATLQLQGSFSSANLQFVSDGSGGTDIFVGTSTASALVYGQTIDETGIIATSETVNAGTMTLFNGGGTAVGTIVVGTSLNSSDFTLRTDGSTGTDVIVSTVFGTYANGVTLLTNPTTIAATAAIGDTLSGGIAVNGPIGTAWTITNLGSISETGAAGFGVSLAGAGTVVNAAMITSNGSAAVYIAGAGGLTNQSGGTITDTASGYYAVEFGGSGSVVNNGTILGGDDAVLGQALLSVINTGVMTATGNEGNGIRLNAGGFVTNSGSGTITGRYGIRAFSSPVTIYNSGSIRGTAGQAIYLHSGTAVNSGVILASGANPGIYVGANGNITNLSGGTITGNTGVVFRSAFNDTLINGGTIDGTSGTAVSFDGAGAHLLIDDPGAVFTGAIFGGTTGNSTAVFELASGASAGTISGFGTSITNFTSLVFDTGADWTVSGNASANGLGTLAIAGFATGDTIDLTGFVAVSETFGSNEVTFSNSAAATVTLHLEGSFSSTNFQVAALGTTGTKIYAGAAQVAPLDYGQTIVETGIIATSETVTAGILTLFDGASPVGTIVVGTSLSTGDFTLTPDGPSTEVIVKTVFGTYASGVSLLTNPTTIGSLAHVGIATANGDAVYGSGDENWTLTNEGLVAATGSHGNGVYLKTAGVVINESTITSTGTYGTGVYLQAGGVVTNTASGVISGQAYGVAVYGTSTVDNSGTILGTAGGAVSLYGGTLNNAGLIADGANGLGVFFFQAGVVTNSASGTITAANNYGIDFVHTAQITNAGTVESAETAIYAQGVMTVANTGLILGTGTHGVGLDLKGGGQVTNNATGAIGGVEFGITAQAAATVTNNGTIMGGLAAVYDKAALTVANTGVIDATGSNSVGVSLHAGGFVTNSVGGTITGAGYGVASFGPATVENSGTILGTVRGAVSMFSGTVANSGVLADVGTSAGSGIYIYQAGNVTNLTGGTITATSGVGIAIGGTGNVVNNGTVAAGAAAISVKGLASVTNTGVILATDPKSQGVYLKDGGFVTNSATGTISGTGYGVYLNGPGTVENSGTILGMNIAAVSMFYGTVGNSGLIADSGGGAGIYSDHGGIVRNLSGGTITAATGDGIFLNGSATVTNLGTIASTAGDAVSVLYGTVVNSNLIESGGSFAVYSYIGGNGYVTNLSGGTIIATTGVAIHIDGTAEVTNNGTIEGGSAAIYGASAMTVSNSGVVLGTSTGGNGMYLAMGGYVSNSSTGTISGGQYGIESHGTTTVVNNGTILANAYAAISMLAGTVDNGGLLDGTGSALAIYIGGNGSVTNAAGGTIMATTVTGIIIAGTGTVANNGLIEGGASAVYVKGLATVTNNGVILGTSTTSSAVHMVAGGFVTNSGRALISGGRYGILAGGTGTVDNSGTIQSSGDEAISLKVGTVVNSGLVTMLGAGGGVYLGAGTVTNSGTIKAGSISGAVYIYGNGGVTNLATGTITGGYGVEFSGGYTNTVNNAGTIIGNAGTAVYFLGDGDHLLVDNPGAVFTGAIYGGNGATAEFELASGASTGTIAGFGGTVTNFTSLVFDTGARWTVRGNDLPSGLGTLGISGFAAGDTIDLASFVAVTETFGSNEVTFTNNFGETDTLNLRGSLSSATLQFSGDGSGGTNVYLGAPRSLIYGQTIDQAGIIATSEVVTAGTLTMFDGTIAAGTIVVGTSLNTSDFTLRSDGAGGTDVIVSTVFGTYASGVTLLTNPTTIAGTARVSDPSLAGNAVYGPAGTAWTLTNQGILTATGDNGDGVRLKTGGVVDNTGTILGNGTAGKGVQLGAGGFVGNSAGGVIGGAYGVFVVTGAGTVDNGGTIHGTSGTGVYLASGTLLNTGLIEGNATSAAVYLGGAGNVTNLQGGTITGSHGIFFHGVFNETLNNFGTIIGGAGTAVSFGGGVNRLIDNPGAVFTGAIFGGGGAASEMELTSGASTGTIAGFGGTVTNFTSLVFDTDAQWTVTGNDSASGLGTLGIAGFATGDTIDLTGFVAVSETFGGNEVTFTNSLDATATLHLEGSFSSADLQFVSDGSGGTEVYAGTATIPVLLYGQTIDQAGIIATSETVTAGTMTLFNGGSAVGTIVVGTSLNSSDFTLRTDGSSGTDVIVSTVFGTYASGVTLLTNPATITGTARVSDSALNGRAVTGPSGTAWTVTNLGTIDSTNTGGIGVYLKTGGAVTNSGGGSINGASYGVEIDNAAGTVANSGTIQAGTGNAVYLSYGIVTNSGMITSTGSGGVYIKGAGVITNLSGGVITANAGAGISTEAAATIDNYGGISGAQGVVFEGTSSQTLNNHGTIIGGTGTAVSFAGGTNTLIDNPGAVFTGAIRGGDGGSSIMELASGAGAGTIAGFGGTITNFTSLVFEPDAQWTVSGNASASGLGTLGIAGFAGGDKIDLTGFTAVSETFANNSLVLTDALANHATLAILGNFSSANFQIAADGDGGTDIILGTPSVSGTVPNQGVPNETPSHPFATVVVTNPAIAAIETATVTLSAPGNGTLSNLSTGSYDASTGVYSVTGTPAVDTAALEALVFTPIAQPNVDVVTTGFAISPGAGGVVDTTTSVTSVQQILGLAAVPLNQIAISVSPDGSSFAPAVDGDTNEAVVSDPVEGGAYTTPAGYQALFLGGTADATLSDTIAGGALLVANSGNDELIAGAPNDILVAGSGNDSLVGGSFASTVFGGSGASTVFAGSGTMRVVEGSGPISFGGNGNAGSTIFGGTGPDASPLTADLTGQNQTVSVGGSAATITVGGGADMVIGGSSTLNVTVSGAADTVQAGTGASTVVSGGSGGMVIGSSVAGAGPLIVTETGTNDTIAGGTNPTTVTATSGTGTSVSGGSGGLTFVGGIGTSTVLGGTGPVSITAGAGGVVFNTGTSNNATVDSGSGTVTIFGAAGTTVNLIGSAAGSASQPNYVVAGSGGETLNAAGSSGADWLSVNTTVSGSAAVMIAGSGNDTLLAGSAPGATTMTGGIGSDAFVFFKQAVGGGHDVINNFTANDSVYIEGYGPGSAGALQTAATVGAGGTTLTLSDGTSITFSNLSSASALDGKIQYG